MEIRWLGNACLEVRGQQNLLLDPNYMLEPESDPDIILVTHEHDDHLSSELIEDYEEKKIFAPYTVFERHDIQGEKLAAGEEIAGSIQAYECDCYGSDYSLCYYFNGLYHTADAAQFPALGGKVNLMFTACFPDFYQDYLQRCREVEPGLVIPYHYNPEDNEELSEAEGLVKRLQDNGFNAKTISPGQIIEI